MSLTARHKQLLLALSAALFAAIGAYALGSTSNDGAANAANTGGAATNTRFAHNGPTGPTGRKGPGHRAGRGHGGPWFGGPTGANGPAGARGPHQRLTELADKLGVTEEKLLQGIQTARQSVGAPAARGPGRAFEALKSAVAKELGVSEAKVEAAWEKAKAAAQQAGTRSRGPRDFFGAGLTAAAKELGVSEAELRSALEKAHDTAHAAERAERAKELADAIGGVSAAQVAEALDAIRPNGRDGKRPGGSFKSLAAALATELGISEARVNAGFDKLENARRAEATQRQAEFVSALAKALGLDEAKVKAAVGDTFLFGGHGRGGPGAPGRFGHGHP